MTEANNSLGKPSKVVMFYFVPQGQKAVPPPEFFKNACTTSISNETPAQLTNVDPQQQKHSIKFHRPISLAEYSNFLSNKNGMAPNPGKIVAPAPMLIEDKKFVIANTMNVNLNDVKPLLNSLQKPSDDIPFKKVVDANYISRSPPPADCLDNIKIESIFSLANPPNIYEPEVIINEELDEIPIRRLSGDKIPTRHLSDDEVMGLKKTGSNKKKIRRMNIVLPPGLTIKQFKHAVTCRPRVHKLSDDEVHSIMHRQFSIIDDVYDDSTDSVPTIQRPLFSNIPERTSTNVLSKLKAKLRQKRQQLENIRAKYKLGSS